MDGHGRSFNSVTEREEDMDLRRGPWTVEEDLTLMNYIANHGEGRWNSLARCAGLKRTGKSCRLRWLNYLRPDVRRGNITPEEQLLILELHSRWGNRWSKIAQHLPGRTDNEIKNYWRTRVQKHAKQLQCDVNSKQFRDTMRYLWMPRLVEKIRAATIASGSTSSNTNTTNPRQLTQPGSSAQVKPNFTPEYSSTAASSDSIETQVSPVSDFAEFCFTGSNDGIQAAQVSCPETLTSPYGYFNQGYDFSGNNEQNEWFGGDVSENLWDMEDIWFMQQQQFSLDGN